MSDIWVCFLCGACNLFSSPCLTGIASNGHKNPGGYRESQAGAGKGERKEGAGRGESRLCWPECVLICWSYRQACTTVWKFIPWCTVWSIVWVPVYHYRATCGISQLWGQCSTGGPLHLLQQEKDDHSTLLQVCAISVSAFNYSSMYTFLFC